MLAAAFGRAYEVPPGIEAVETYDAFRIIFAAIRFSGDTTPDAIQDGLYRMGPYEGVPVTSTTSRTARRRAA